VEVKAEYARQGIHDFHLYGRLSEESYLSSVYPSTTTEISGSLSNLCTNARPASTLLPCGVRHEQETLCRKELRTCLGEAILEMI
jgi:hypothetical protein